MNRRRVVIGLGGVLSLVTVAAVAAVVLRAPIARLMPIHHTGVVMRIAPTGEPVSYELFFADGFHCEGSDTSFAAIRVGDTLEIRGYPDVSGTPLVAPTWGECTDARLERLLQESPAPSG